MKKIALAALLGTMSTLSPAQTQIEKYTAGGQPQGTFYYLPKTALRINVLVEKTSYTPGSLCMYADKYLRLKDVRQTPEVSHRIINVDITPFAVADTAKCYTVKYSGKSVGTNMQLSEDGCLLAVNTENEPQKAAVKFTPSPKQPTPDPRSYLSEEIISAGSTAKMAQLIAQDIYDIRESKNMLTRGQADFMPKDGEQLKLMLAQLTQQENAMTGMFAGTVECDTAEYTIELCPDKEFDKAILFRLSKQLGLVDKDDLSGTPYYIYIKNMHTIQLPDNTAKKKKSKEEGIYVNVPEKIKVTVAQIGKELCSKDIQMAQFGYTELISGDLFKRNTTKLKLFPTTGGIQKLEAEQPK